jgi:hypothetical protein
MIKKVWLGWEKENEYYSLNMRGDAAGFATKIYNFKLHFSV